MDKLSINSAQEYKSDKKNIEKLLKNYWKMFWNACKDDIWDKNYFREYCTQGRDKYFLKFSVQIVMLR